MEAASVGTKRGKRPECLPGYIDATLLQSDGQKNNPRFNGEMSEELLYDYDDDMLQIDLDYFNQFDNLFNDSSGTDSFRFANPTFNNLLLIGML